jgi:hypothetical protein
MLTSSAEVKKELIYTSTHPMGLPGPVTRFPLPFAMDLSHLQLGQMVPCLQFLFRMLPQHSS